MNRLSLVPLLLGVVGLTVLAQVALAGEGRFATYPWPLAQLALRPSGEANLISYQRQSSTLTLSRNRLNEPHRLSIRSEGATRLSGQIQVNGRVVKTLEPGTTTLDLAPYLSGNTTTVALTADYAPASARVAMEFTGPETTVSQQTSGNGQLNYELVLELR